MENYTVVNSDFHGASPISRHRTLSGALRSAIKTDCTRCTCGGTQIIGESGAMPELKIAYDYYRYVGRDKADAIVCAVHTWPNFKN